MESLESEIVDLGGFSALLKNLCFLCCVKANFSISGSPNPLKKGKLDIDNDDT